MLGRSPLGRAALGQNVDALNENEGILGDYYLSIPLEEQGAYLYLGEFNTSGSWSIRARASFAEQDINALFVLEFNGTTDYIDYGIYFSTNQLKIHSDNKTPGNGATTIKLNQFYDFELVWDGTSYHSYIDGVLDYSINPTQNNNHPLATIKVLKAYLRARKSFIGDLKSLSFTDGAGTVHDYEMPGSGYTIADSAMENPASLIGFTSNPFVFYINPVLGSHYLAFLDSDDYVEIAPIPVMQNFDLEFQFETTSATDIALIGSNTPTRALNTNDHFAIIIRADGIPQVFNGSERINGVTPLNDGLTHTAKYSVRNHTGGFSGTSQLFIDGVKEGDTRPFRGAALADSNVVFIGRTVPVGDVINGSGLNLKKFSITDFDTVTNNRNYNTSSSNGTGSILRDDIGGNDGKLVNFTLPDAWQYYEVAHAGVVQTLALSAESQVNTALLLNIISNNHLNAVTATQSNNASAVLLDVSQQLNAIKATQSSNESSLLLEQLQALGLISAQQTNEAQTILISQIDSIEFLSASQESEAQIFSIVQREKLKVISTNQFNTADLLNIIASSDDTDLTGLTLTQITNIYTLSTTKDIYTLEKQ